MAKQRFMNGGYVGGSSGRELIAASSSTHVERIEPAIAHLSGLVMFYGAVKEDN